MNSIPPKEWLDELAENIEAGYDPKTATVSEKTLASLTKKMHESLVLLYAERDALENSNAEAWNKGVATALSHAIKNDDGVTLRLQHLDDTPWINPYSGEPYPSPSPKKES